MKKFFLGFTLLFLSSFCFSQQEITIKGETPLINSLNFYRIQVGAFIIPENAENVFSRLKNAGLEPSYEDHGDFKRVILAALRAQDIPMIMDKIRTLGFTEVWIIQDNTNNMTVPALSESAVLDPRYYTLTIGESKIIGIPWIPDNSNAVWESSDTDIATVDTFGQIVGRKNGSVEIMASYNGSLQAIDVAVVPTYDFYEVPRDNVSNVIYSENTTTGTQLLTEYNTEPTFRLAYKFNNPTEDLGASGINGGIDILGKGTNNKWMWTSYFQGGFFYDLNGVHRKMIDGVQTDANGVILTVEPSFVYDEGVAYLQLTHRLENTSSITATGQKFGASSDVMIDRNDHAPLTINRYGVLMTDTRDNEIASLNLKFICKEGNNVTPASTVWIGPWDGGDHLNHIYDNGVSENYRDGVDSAMAFSYQDITLSPGESKYYTVRLTLSRNSN